MNSQYTNTGILLCKVEIIYGVTLLAEEIWLVLGISSRGKDGKPFFILVPLRQRVQVKLYIMMINFLAT